MAKNPFKKKSIIKTIYTVGLGGAANVAMDYVADNVDFLSTMGESTRSLVKVGVGVLAGTMIKGDLARAAFDGIATVGASELVNQAINGNLSWNKEATSGLPAGTIGRAAGNPYFKRHHAPVSSCFMGK